MLDKFQDQIQKFMVGRYGPDRLSKRIQQFIFVLLILGIITSVFDLAGTSLFYFLTLFLILFNYYRMFSKDYQVQRKIQESYFQIESKVKKPFKRLIGTKDHIYTPCPNCKESLRLPRKKAKLKVSCPRCKYVFYKRT